jgi:methyl-accepting chemotaxis protein
MTSALRISLVAVGGLLAVAAFAFLLKLMADMADHMGRMTQDISGMAEDMHSMGNHISGLSEQVTGIRVSVDSMSADMHEMRASVDRMSAVIQSGGRQIEQINPMGAMQKMMPSGR